MFSIALGLAKPWRVADIKFSKEEGRLDLLLDFAKSAKFPCPTCPDTPEGEVHDTQDRTWRHLNFFQYETYLHARVPRIHCGTCGVKQFEIPWARPGSGFTLLFELIVLSLSREISVSAVSELTSEHANRLWRILGHYVERARGEVDLSRFESYFWATHSRQEPVIRAERMIKRYWTGAVGYLDARVSNGVVERLNSKIKTAMKRACVFKHVDYLRTIIYLTAGRLTFNYPQ